MRVTAGFALGLTLVSSYPANAQQLEFKMISSGPNRPGVGIWASPMREILAGLHVGIAPRQMASMLAMSEADLTLRIDSLRNDGVVREVDGTARPSCMVVTVEEGTALAALADDAARRTMPLMRRTATALAEKFQDVAGLRRLGFEDAGFFLMSDVILDNWQIRSVEQRWLKADRPLRGRSRYYCAIFPRPATDREAFGIFGNQVSGLADGRLLGTYGNRRGGSNDLVSLSQSKLAALASMPDTASRGAALTRVANRLEGLALGSTTEARDFMTSLEALGLVRQGHPRFAVFDSADYSRLTDLAATLTPSLVELLDGFTPELRAAWQASRWRDETTFEEFAIWWYHFFYSAVTERLAAEGMIRIPDTGLFLYIVSG